METKELEKLFPLELETSSIKEKDISEKVVKSSMLKLHSIKAVVLKLCQLGEDHIKNLQPLGEQLTSSKKVLHYLKETKFQKVPSVSSALSVSSKSLQFRRKFTNEQTRYLLSLTKDLTDNNAIKREVIWKRVLSNQKALKLGLITGKEEDEDEVQRAKQHLDDKVRHEAKRRQLSKKK